MDDVVLAQVREREMQILDMIDQFCSKHDIQYSLTAGSALGAVRHQGFIPWDDDMDIMMTRMDFTKFCTTWNEEPVEGFYLQFLLWDHDVGITHAKMRMNNTIYLSEGEAEIGHHGIWVDIFPLDKLSKESHERKKVISCGKKLILLSRADMAIRNLPLKKKVVQNALRIIPRSLRHKMQEKCVQQLIASNQQQLYDYDWVSMSTLPSVKVIYPMEMMEKTVSTKFENRRYRILTNINDYLCILYGDYMTLPPENERKLAHKPIKIKT